MKEKYRPFPKETSLRDMLRTYTNECVKVTFLMNACTPPMWIDFSDPTYDSKKHTKYDGKGDNIHYFVWPCVYFSKKAFEAGKPVLERGEVVVCGTANVHQSSNIPPKESQMIESFRKNYSEQESRFDDEAHEQMLENSVNNSQNGNKVLSQPGVTRIQVRPGQVVKGDSGARFSV